MTDKRTYQFKIKDLAEFKKGLEPYVDTSVDCYDKSFDPLLLEKDFFGQFEKNEFNIFHKKCDIEISGEVKDEYLFLNFSFPNRLNIFFDIVVYSVVGISIMYDINLLLGLTITLLALIWKSYDIYYEEIKKKAILKRIQEIINEE